MQLSKSDQEEWLATQLEALGTVVGFIVGIALLPWLSVFRVHNDVAISLWVVLAIGGSSYAGSYTGKRLPRYLNDDGSEICISLLGRINCKLLRSHDLKPDQAFPENGCQCIRCGYRPKRRALDKLR